MGGAHKVCPLAASSLLLEQLRFRYVAYDEFNELASLGTVIELKVL